MNPDAPMNDDQSAETTEQQKSPLKSAIQIAIPLVISVGLMVWILSTIKNPEQVWTSIRAASWLSLTGLLVMSLVPHLIRAWRWRRLIGEPVSLFYSFTSVMIGYAVNDVLPRAGEVARVVNMNRMTRVPLAKLLSTLLAERLIDVIVLAFLLAYSIAIEGERFASIDPRLVQLADKSWLAFAVPVAAMLGLVAIAFVSEWLCGFFGGLFGRVSPGIGEKVEGLIRQGAEGLAFFKSPYQALMVTIETVAIWVCYWASFALGLHAFGLTAGLNFEQITIAFAITSCSVLVPTVGGIGAYHAFGEGSLVKLYGVAQAPVVACIAVVHLLVFYVVGGLFGALAWGAQVWVRKKEPVVAPMPHSPAD